MSLPTVLIIDDEPDFCSDLSLVLSRDFLVSASHDGKEALELVDELSPDLVLLDVEFRPGQMPGLEILEHLQAKEDPPPVIMLSGSRDINVVVQAVKLGAFHYVNKGADLPDLVNLMGMAMSSRRDRLTIMAQRAEVQRLTGNLIARDPATIKILDKVDQVAATDVNVLITGESGTGKEMIARRLHNESGVSGTFVGINCATFEGDLINSEIFGHVKGAFTGADRDHMGKIELATGGTLFLDEIGESDPKFQSRLLRALSEKTYTRVGLPQGAPGADPDRGGHQQEAERCHAAGGIPGRPLLPPEPVPHPCSTLARADRGHPAPGPGLPHGKRRPLRQGLVAVQRGGGKASGAAALARERA
jgi:DNA-binding NtrC family response regulator